MTQLAKHVAGKTLSPAELEERRNAARARWAAAGAVAGAAIGTAAAVKANSTIRALRARTTASLRALHQPVRAENARSAAVLGGIKRREALGLSAIRKWPVPPYRTMLVHDAHVTARKLRALPVESFGVDPETGEDLRGPADQAQASRLAGEINRNRDEMEDLKDATPPKTGMRRGGQAKVPRAHTRETSVQDKETPEARAQRLADLEARHDAMLEQLKANGGTEDELAELAAQQSAKRERIAAKPPRSRGAKKIVPVGHDRTEAEMQAKVKRTGGKFRRQGNPDDKTLAVMRDKLRDRIQTAMRGRRYREIDRHFAAASQAKAGFRAAAAPLVRWRLPTRAFRRGAIGAAIGLGALGGYFASRELGKGAPPPPNLLNKSATAAPPAQSDTLATKGVAAQESMEARLARIFRSWKDEIAPRLLKDEPLSLRDRFRADLTHATEPMAEALAAGADQPMQGREKTIVGAVGDARNPLVEAYLRNYRESKIADLTEEQVEAVKNQLIDAAQSGASPQQMAARIKATIGLTTNQAAQVLNYRRELETGNPNALKRQLRDKRYDPTVSKSIFMADAKPLTTSQIDAMVDAYHRRYLAYRAMTIARTEGVSAANNGHMAAVQDVLDHHPELVVVKTWMAELDEKTRPDHFALHGQSVVGFDTPFKCDSGDLIRWPGDQAAPARAVVNCRCTIVTRLVSKSVAAKSKKGGDDE